MSQNTRTFIVSIFFHIALLAIFTSCSPNVPADIKAEAEQYYYNLTWAGHGSESWDSIEQVTIKNTSSMKSQKIFPESKYVCFEAIVSGTKDGQSHNDTYYGYFTYKDYNNYQKWGFGGGLRRRPSQDPGYIECG